MTLQVKFNPELLPPGYTDVQEPDDIDTPSVQSGHVQHSTEGMVIRVPVVPTHPPHIEIVPDRGAGSAAHPTIEIGSLLDVRLRLHVPIVVNLEQEDAFYIAK